eukprot:TRINITY_DN1553_c1_g1_i1.p1 TRINITY_DN1553_c1_g1~~TRINITY_DN1553_c1_g1_i1.p1  ORF type:complete len:398 (+),score=149.05 TRINITY_DN1553_c1_g1_i1:77-1270(+)
MLLRRISKINEIKFGNRFNILNLTSNLNYQKKFFCSQISSIPNSDPQTSFKKFSSSETLQPRFSINFLGTSSGSPTNCRNVSSIAIETLFSDSNSLSIVDCGESTFYQLLLTGYDPCKINRILITHLHGDHVFGLIGLLILRAARFAFKRERYEPLQIYGPHILSDLLSKLCKNVNAPSFLENGEIATINEIGINSISSFEFVVNDGRFYVKSQFLKDWSSSLTNIQTLATGVYVDPNKKYRISASPIAHSVITWGYVFEAVRDENDYLPPLKILPFPASRNEKINYYSNQKTTVKVTILGDTNDARAILPLANNSDLIIHECTLPRGERQKATERGHSTIMEAATFARLAQCPILGLTHFGKSFINVSEIAKLENDISKLHGLNCFIATDFLNIRI